MALEHITGEKLSEVRSGLRKLVSAYPDAILKFVLLKSPDQKGYLRVDRGPEHISTLGRLQDYLRGQGEFPLTFVQCGGGMVDVYHQDTVKRTRLHFYSQSSVLGAFDRDLLQQILAEALDKEKFLNSHSFRNDD